MFTGGVTKRAAAIGFSVLLAGTILLVAATSGLGSPSVPDEAIAYVEDASNGEITQEQFDAGIEQAAARQQIQRVPEPGTPQYDLLQETAMADLLLSRWVRGEAEELGVEVSDREVDEELESIIDDQFGSQKRFEQFLRQSKFSEDDARDRVRLQILSERIQERVLGSELPEVPEGDIEDFYEENRARFETPETRDVRTLLNPDQAKAQDAFDRLSEDDSPGAWRGVTRQLSTDEATSGLGGLRQGVAEGQNEGALDEEIFSAEEGELVGPFETDAGFYVLQVQAINEAATQALDEQTSQQIQQTLATERQQEAAAAYQTSFLAKWRARTACSEDFAIDRCGNAPPPPDACQGDDPDEEPALDPTTGEPSEGCPAPVPSIRPVPPSSAGERGATGLPQGPQGIAPAQPELPQGLPTIPQGGAPGAPPGG